MPTHQWKSRFVTYDYVNALKLFTVVCSHGWQGWTRIETLNCASSESRYHGRAQNLHRWGGGRGFFHFLPVSFWKPPPPPPPPPTDGLSDFLYGPTLWQNQDPPVFHYPSLPCVTFIPPLKWLIQVLFEFQHFIFHGISFLIKDKIYFQKSFTKSLAVA